MGKILITMFLLSSFLITYSQDTTVRKRFIDSLRHELSTYTIMSYNHLNMYDRSEAEKYKIKEKLSEADEYIGYIREFNRRRNIKYGAFFAGLSCLFMTFIITSHNK